MRLPFLSLALLVAPASAQVSVDATVDPRMELAAIGQWVSAAYSSTFDSAYKSDAWAHFSPHRDHPGLDPFREFDMYPDFTEVALLLTPDLQSPVQLPDSLIWYGAYGRDGIRSMLDGLAAFARDADFLAFRQRHAEAYPTWEEEAAASLREGGALDVLDAFFRYGDSRPRPSVRVILEPLNGWGAHAITQPALVDALGGDGIVAYQIGPSWKSERLPDSDLSFVRDDGALAWHESAHVYAGPILRQSADEIAALSSMFDADDERLQNQNVTTWDYAFEENLVRGIVIALTRQVQGETRAARMARSETQSGFVYASQIADLIHAEYDDRYADFDAFVPRVLEHLGNQESSAGAGGRGLENPATWDRALFAQDSAYAQEFAEVDVPIRIGAFPVPVYDSPGNGNALVEVELEGFRLAGHAATVGRSDETLTSFAGLPEASGAVAVTVLVVGGEPGPVFATSRNHPTYLAQGRVVAPEAGIDWVSIVLPDAQDRLVINTRVFDLGGGRTVLVAPLADGTLRFLQVDTPPLAAGSLEEMKAIGPALEDALDTRDVRAFLNGVSSRLPTAP